MSVLFGTGPHKTVSQAKPLVFFFFFPIGEINKYIKPRVNKMVNEYWNCVCLVRMYELMLMRSKFIKNPNNRF